MKTIILMDCSGSDIQLAGNAEARMIDTTACGEEEYDVISKEILKLDAGTLLVRFSGNEDVAQELGDDFSDMIITLSKNPKSKSFVTEDLGDLVRMFQSAA